MKALFALFLFGAWALGGLAQNAPVDFEPGGFGASWTWTVFENDDNPPLEIIANPDMSGANVSGTVAKFTARQNGQAFAGCETMHGADIGAFTLTPETSEIRIMVWKDVISDVGIKLVEANSASLGEIKIANTVTNAWEEIVFDFSSMEGIEYDQIVVFPDFAERTEDHVIYFDNITFGESTPLPVPMVAAPDPTEDPDNVIALFSGVYTEVPVSTWLTGWSAAAYEELEIEGNPTKKYSGLDFAGIETVGEDLIDASEMDYFHMDVWTPNATTFRIKLVDFGADMSFDGGDDSEHELVFEDHPQGTWVSYQLNLNDFTNLTNQDHIAQLIISSIPVGGGVVYIDNVYFSKEALSIDENRLEVNLYPNPATDVLHVNTGAEVEWIRLMDLSGRVLLEEHGDHLNVDDLPRGNYLVEVVTSSGMVIRQVSLK